MWKILLTLAVLGLALAEDPFSCYAKTDVVYDRSDPEVHVGMDEDDEVECASGQNSCYITEYQRGEYTFRDYGCSTGTATSNECPTVNSRKKRSTKSCIVGEQYKTSTIAEGKHTLECATNYEKRNTGSNYNLVTYCYNGVAWDEEQYEKNNNFDQLTGCQKTRSRWTGAQTFTYNVRVMVNTETALAGRDYMVGETARVSCLDNYEVDSAPTGAMDWTSPDYGLIVTANTNTGFAATFVNTAGARVQSSNLRCKRIKKRWTATNLAINSAVATNLRDGRVILSGASTGYTSGTQFYVGQTLTVVCRNRQYEKMAGSAMVSDELKIKVIEGADDNTHAKWVNSDGGADVDINDIDCSLLDKYNNDYVNLQNWNGANTNTFTFTGDNTDSLLPGYAKGDITVTCPTNYKLADSRYSKFTYQANGANQAYYNWGGAGSFSSWQNVVCVVDTQNAIYYDAGVEAALAAKNQKFVKGATSEAFDAPQMITSAVGLYITCMDGFVRPYKSSTGFDVLAEWPSTSVKLTFAAGAAASNAATLKSATGVNYKNMDACVKPRCAVQDLKDLNFDVYSGINTNIRYSWTTVNHGSNLYVACNAKEHEKQDVNGVTLKAYQCGSNGDGTFGDMFYACTEYKNCSTIVSCQESYCNGGFTLHPTVFVLVAAILAVLFR